MKFINVMDEKKKKNEKIIFCKHVSIYGQFMKMMRTPTYHLVGFCSIKLKPVWWVRHLQYVICCFSGILWLCFYYTHHCEHCSSSSTPTYPLTFIFLSIWSHISTFCISWNWLFFDFVSPALVGKTHRDRFVPCCGLLWKWVKIWLLNSTCFDGF